MVGEGQKRYIDYLKYASEKETFTIRELAGDLNLSEEEVMRLAYLIGNNEIFLSSHVNFFRYYEDQEIDLRMSIGDTFRLLEYTELKEARESSKKSTVIAIIAIVISIFSSFFSGVISWKSLHSEVNYPNDVKQLIENISETNEYLAREMKRFSEK